MELESFSLVMTPKQIHRISLNPSLFLNQSDPHYACHHRSDVHWLAHSVTLEHKNFSDHCLHRKLLVNIWLQLIRRKTSLSTRSRSELCPIWYSWDKGSHYTIGETLPKQLLSLLIRTDCLSLSVKLLYRHLVLLHWFQKWHLILV